ncbi:MAG TPA: ATP-binding protein [Gaiellaceae bacterium]|nr:ATP-binding protein [Gaiellaceae bacterium]
MPVRTKMLSSLPQLRGLLEVSRLVREERDLARLSAAIAATISEALGFRTVAINLYRPAEGDFEVATVHGSEGAREALIGTTRPADAWTSLLSDRFLRRGAYLIPPDEGDWDDLPFHVPDLAISEDPDAWHPEDALIVPMRGADGMLLGVISVDEPESGLRPTDEELEVLVGFAQHVTGAIEAVQVAAAAARDRASLAQLFDVSASLVELDSVDEVLQAVAHAISHALEFEKVAVCLARDGGFPPAGTAGWEPDDPGLDFTLTDADLDALFVPEFEAAGCYLIEQRVATALVGGGSNYESQRGGAGPRAWSRHWLLVPLVGQDGSRSGFIWADDPSDSMLPSNERLQALRTFANQATIALRAADAFETLNARNSELAGLYTALQQSEELHRRIVDCSTDLISVVDLEGTTIVTSPSAFHTLGFRQEEIVGQHFAQLVHPDDLVAAAQMFADALERSTATATVRVRHADGSWVLLDAIASVIADPDGRPQHILATGRDVTESHRLHEQLRQAQKMESIGRLAGGIAHDFNNLLTAIGGYAELILLDYDSGADPTRDSAEQIARATARAASLTAQLLAFSRKQVLRPQVIDLNEVVGGMATMVARMLGEDVVLSTEFDPETISTLADPGQIEQVVLNLALNARDAMPDGGSLVIWTAPFELGDEDEPPHPDLEPGSYVTLCVRDSGVGIDPDLITTVFEPFFTTKAVGEGTGLGLATVHGIVSQSGGVIWVESTPGVGSTFTVCLPLVEPS